VTSTPAPETPRPTLAGSGVRAAYDAIARSYDAQLGDELKYKPLDRAFLNALVELVGTGVIADVGCGPGHVTRFLAARHSGVMGVDLSPGMIAVARERSPDLPFTVGSMLQLPAADSSWGGAILLYSIIHLTAQERAAACRELARVVRPRGWVLIAFHIDSPEFPVGSVNHITEWFGESVDLNGFFLEPPQVTHDVATAGFAVMATTVRNPQPGIEYPSRRCYLLAQRR
jgi:ubiquinone/menaquinone biosynthesis C-methylase UbiE